MSKHYTELDKAGKITAILKACEDMSTAKACEASSVPTNTFMNWLANNATKSADLAHARTLYHDKLAQDILDLSNEKIPKDLERGEANAWVQRQRLRIDAIKWILSKVAHRKYGDRLTLDGDKENPIAIAKIERRIITTEGQEIKE